jgi:hypothetical protein
MAGTHRLPERFDLVSLRDAHIAARLAARADPLSTSAAWDAARADFEARHGPIQAFVFAERLSGGLVSLEATSQSWLDPFPHRAYRPAARLLDSIEVLLDSGHRQLLSGERTAVERELVGIAADLFAYLDYVMLRSSATSESDDLDDDIARFASRLAGVDARLRAAAETRAQFWYVQGMLTGVAAIIVGAAAAGVPMGMMPNHLISFPSFAGALIAGAFGASVSVLSRMTRGRLTVDPEAGKGMLWFLGIVRPLVGAVLAVALYFGIAAGVVPLRVPVDESANLAFYVTVGFLAGFSERYAQDMLLLGGRDRTATSTLSTPPTGERQGEANDADWGQSSAS